MRWTLSSALLTDRRRDSDSWVAFGICFVSFCCEEGEIHAAVTMWCVQLCCVQWSVAWLELLNSLGKLWFPKVSTPRIALVFVTLVFRYCGAYLHNKYNNIKYQIV